MIQDVKEKFKEKDTLEAFLRLFEKDIFYDRQKNAFGHCRKLEMILFEAKKDRTFPEEIYDVLFASYIRLKFVALPLLRDEEVVQLLKNYFVWLFDIEDYDLEKKFRGKLISIEVYEDRDEFKREVVQAMQKSDAVISGKTKMKTIAQWVGNYNVNLGLDIVDNLPRRQYLMKLKNEKEMSERYQKRLKILFDFYESLKFSSLTPQGFEEDTPMEVNKTQYLFSRGELIPVGKHAQKTKAGKLSAPKTESERNIEKLRVEEQSLPENSLERAALGEEVDKQKHLEDLQYQASKFVAGSLERMALDEEISRLKK